MAEPGTSEWAEGLSKVQERSLRLAAEYGRSQEEQARNFLNKYAKRAGISEEQVGILGVLVRVESAAQYLDERIAGRHNDNCNTEPGITAIVRENFRSRATEALGDLESASLAPSFEEVGALGNFGTLYRMQLDRGWFEHRDTSVKFYLDGVEAGPDQRTAGVRGFAVGLFDVVTIEGVNDGTFWQNRAFDLGAIREVGSSPQS